MYNYNADEYKDLLDSIKGSKTKRLEKIANRIARTKVVVNIKKDSDQCFCGPRKGFHYIQLGTMMGLSGPKKVSNDEFFFKLVGAIAHEAGHARFTNFEPAVLIKKATEKAQKNVTKLAQEWLDTGNDDLLKEIEEETYNYVYNVHLFTMDNSYEDAFIESEIIRNCSKIPFVYTGLTLLRDEMTETEEEGARTYINSGQVDKKTNQYIKGIIADMRHMAVVGYKNYPCEYPMLYEHGFTNDEIDEMMDIAMYARLGSHNSKDVLAAARTAMKFLEDLIRDIAKDYSDKYIEALKKQKDAGATQIDPNLLQSESIGNAFSQEEEEMAISKKMAGSNPGAAHQRDPEFELELPSDVEEEIQNNGGNTSSGSSNSGASNSSNGGSSNGASGSNAQSGENSSKSSGSNESSEESSSDGQEAEKGEKEQKNGAGASENSENEEKKEASTNNGGGANDGNSSVKNSETMKNLQKALEESNATSSKKALSDALSELKKMKKGDAENAMKEAVGGSGHAPQLEGNLGNINSISDMHKGVEIDYYSPKSWPKKDCNIDITQSLSIASRYANKLKKILFAETRDRKLRNLDRGRVDKKNLYHIVTDGKCCYKKLEGKKNTARFCILVDQSGSMSGTKIKDAYVATRMLVSVARKIHVPIAVFGHDASGGSVRLYHYLDYKSPKSMDDNLIHILEDGCCNHDSIPIFQCLTDMARHKKDNENDIFIIISDGAPYGCGNYFGKPAFEDIRNIYSMFEKRYGIKTIGIGIGDDVDCVPEIYKNYIMIPDTEELPQALLDLLKKEI